MRALIIAAHPDDEVIGLGGQLRRFRDPYFVHLTDGAPEGSPANYACVRRAELQAALALAGIGVERTIALGFTDQECSLHLREIASELRRIIGRLQPRTIYTHAYEGGHPDHDSAAWAVQRVADGTPRFEFASYHNRSNSLKTGAFLPGGEHVPRACVLPEGDRELKQQMFDCFKSQREMLGNFRIGVELVRRAPLYDFSRPPHEGTLFYETQPWRNCGEEWRRRAMRSE
jgi:LmbE family N-acetylglucosaminyl deacetylase